MSALPTVLVTGASAGIGATYADRFARRGHDLVLAARDKSRLDALAARIRNEYRVSVDVLQADLVKDEDIRLVEDRLRDDTGLGILINNGGVAQSGDFLQQTPMSIERLITLNTTTPARLAAAIAPRLIRAGAGAIVNVGSIVGFAPEFGMSVYGATKAFILFLSQGLSHELSAKGIYVQAVLPGATRTELWDRAGIDLQAVPELMEVGELVDAAMVGFDRRELVTMPSLHTYEPWIAYDYARSNLLSEVRRSRVGDRYLTLR